MMKRQLYTIFYVKKINFDSKQYISINQIFHAHFASIFIFVNFLFPTNNPNPNGIPTGRLSRQDPVWIPTGQLTCPIPIL